MRKSFVAKPDSPGLTAHKRRDIHESIEIGVRLDNGMKSPFVHKCRSNRFVRRNGKSGYLVRNIFFHFFPDFAFPLDLNHVYRPACLQQEVDLASALARVRLAERRCRQHRNMLKAQERKQLTVGRATRIWNEIRKCRFRSTGQRLKERPPARSHGKPPSWRLPRGSGALAASPGGASPPGEPLHAPYGTSTTTLKNRIAAFSAADTPSTPFERGDNFFKISIPHGVIPFGIICGEGEKR